MSAIKITAIIPARYESSRLPGKPLIEFYGKPMIQWVYERASEIYDSVFIATDDQRIFDAAAAFGSKAILTSPDHSNGTSRVWEAYSQSGVYADYIVNIQGDEPLVAAGMLKDINTALRDDETDIATLIAEVISEDELLSESEVFVVKDANDYALYFSRSVIPHIHEVNRQEWLSKCKFYKHVGMYAYKPKVLRQLVNLPKSSLELAEGLEQNRWLENGFRIRTAVTSHESYPVDVPADVVKVKSMFDKLLA
jgi:3-deoxy-manno-octulosonate cytidylyltransferase (CMP-KDO synthetase)